MCMEVFSHRILTYCFMKIHLNVELTFFLSLSLSLFLGRISLKYCQSGMDFITALTKHGKDRPFFLYVPFGRTEAGMKSRGKKKKYIHVVYELKDPIHRYKHSVVTKMYLDFSRSEISKKKKKIEF